MRYIETVDARESFLSRAEITYHIKMLKQWVRENAWEYEQDIVESKMQLLEKNREVRIALAEKIETLFLETEQSGDSYQRCVARTADIYFCSLFTS